MPFLPRLAVTTSPLQQSGYLADTESFAEDYMAERTRCPELKGCLLTRSLCCTSVLILELACQIVFGLNILEI
jgi:hypothetical protein